MGNRILRHLAHLGLASLLVLGGLASAEQRTIYRTQSPYNTILVTENDRGLRTLHFEPGGARQSVVKVGDPDHLELPYARVITVGLAFVEQPRHVLIVGLGGGTIPSFLRKHYPEMRIDVVEIDPQVVDVARAWFGFREDDAMRVYVKDGRRFIEDCTNRYDVIFLDAFGTENIPYELATREFLRGVRGALTSRGVAVGNLWSYANPLYHSMVRTYQDVFDELYIFDVRSAGNKILVALPREQRIGRDWLVRRSRGISRQRHFRFDLGDLVADGYQYAEEKETGGHVLIDKNKTQETEEQP